MRNVIGLNEVVWHPAKKLVTCEEARELSKLRGVKVYWRPSHLEDRNVAEVVEG